MTFGQKLKFLRQNANMTQLQLAEKLRLSKANISKYESDTIQPNFETLGAISSLFNVPVDYLLGKDPTTVPASNLTPLPQRGMRIIPVYETVSAGFGAQAEDHVIDYLPCFILSESEAEDSIGIKVKGDSMYPKIEDGDIIRVVKQNSVESGQIAVVLVDDEGFVKRVTYGHGFVELQSINPLYPPMRFEGTEAERVRVIGLVRQIIKNV